MFIPRLPHFALRTMEKIARVVLFMSIFSAISICEEVKDGSDIFNVLDYGAAGDGITNDTMAFEETWNNTCNADTDNATMVIPQNKTFLVHLITFNGPCKPENITISLSGMVVAPDSPDAWMGKDQGRWLIFLRVEGLYISGPGMIDGRGNGWWDINCARQPHLQGCVKLAPTVLSFIDSNQVIMSNISVANSPQTHILMSGCNYINFKFLNIDSPESSPNTDGIHIDRCHGVSIDNTKISSGDDCVSIGDYTSNILISNVYCGPGHGISIGSLGKSGNEVQVENITVRNVQFIGTTNGARIKTWQIGRGYVRGITYQKLNFTDVRNPIVIDQHYCDVRDSCKPTQTGVHVTAVHYFGTFGTSKSKFAINLNCSEAVPCTDILLDSVQLASSTPGEKLISSCSNVYGFATKVIEPEPCLLQPK